MAELTQEKKAEIKAAVETDLAPVKAVMAASSYKQLFKAVIKQREDNYKKKEE